MRFLKLLFPIFQSAQSIAGLNLKPSKCNIIVLVQLSDDLYNQIKGWLAVNLPSWVSFQVCSTAKYLGFFLGPEAGAHNWAGPLRKFRDRVAAIRASDAPVSIAVYTYNIRAVPVTSYVSQLIPLPKEAAALERTSMHTVLRLPQQTFHHSDFFNLSELGIKDLRSLTVACKSALFRCAACTVTHWPHWKTQLQTTAAETLPLSHLHDGSLSPPFWDSPPIALNLSTAFAGFPGDQKCSGTTRKFVSSLFPDPCSARPQHSVKLDNALKASKKGPRHFL